MALAPAIRQNPKLSASQLADYLVAPSPIAQLGILRQAKYPGPSKPLIIQYQHARRAIAGCLRDRASLNRIVAAATVDLERRRDAANASPLVRDDAQRSLDIIALFQRNSNALDLWQGEYESPLNPTQPLFISAVEVSVSPDAISLVTRRGDTRVGEVFIRCTIGQGGDAAENRRAEANGMLATIAYMHSVEYLGDRGQPHPSASMVVDVARETVVFGPASVTRRVANIEAACGMIAAIWGTI